MDANPYELAIYVIIRLIKLSREIKKNLYFKTYYIIKGNYLEK